MKSQSLKINSAGKSFNGQGSIVITPQRLPVKPMPNPTPEMLNGDPVFDAIWEVIKSWDVNMPDYYQGYCEASGSHVTLIYDAVMKVLPKP